MAIKVGTEDKKKVYLASWPRPGHADPAGALPVADLRPLARPGAGSAPSGHRAAPGNHAFSRRSGAREHHRGCLMPTRRRRSAAWPRSTLRCTRRSCARPSRSSTPAMAATSSPSSPRPRRSPNRSLPSARHTSIPGLRRLRHRRPSISASMATRRRRPGKNKSSCCTETTSSSLRKGMLSTGVIGW